MKTLNMLDSCSPSIYIESLSSLMLQTSDLLECTTWEYYVKTSRDRLIFTKTFSVYHFIYKLHTSSYPNYDIILALKIYLGIETFYALLFD